MTTENEDIPSPKWLDRTLFPYRNRSIQISGHTIHYIDEGEGPVLLLLHGNGSWSYGFRYVIPELKKRYRTIAPDYPGFGLSKAASGYSFLPAEQTAVVESFVDALGLKDIRLFVEDWGGPIGLGLAGRRPQLFRSLIISNTWAWPAQGTAALERFSKIAGGPVGHILITRFNFMERVAVPHMSIARTMSSAEKQGYTGPYPTPESREPQSIFPREILRSRAYLEEVEGNLKRLVDKPVLVVWGEGDAGFSAAERVKFLDYFPHASVVLMPQAKHFVMVDEPEKSVEAILESEKAIGISM